MKRIIKKALSVLIVLAVTAALIPAVSAKKTLAATDIVTRVDIISKEPLPEKIYAHEFLPSIPEFEFVSVTSSGGNVTLDDIAFDYSEYCGYCYPYESGGNTWWDRYEEDERVKEGDNRLIVALYLKDGVDAILADDVEVYLNGESMDLQKMYDAKQDAEFFWTITAFIKVPEINITTTPAITAPSFGDPVVNPTVKVGMPFGNIVKPSTDYCRWEDDNGYDLEGTFDSKYAQYHVWLEVTNPDYYDVLEYTDTKAYINGEEAEIIYSDWNSVHIVTPVYDTGGKHVEVISYLRGSGGDYGNLVSINGTDYKSYIEKDFAPNSTVTLYAQAGEGCSFVEWRKGDAYTGEVLGTSPTLNVTVTDDATYCAVFDKDVPATGHLTDTVDYIFDESTGTLTLIPTGPDGKGSARMDYYDDNPLRGNMRIKHVVIQEGITEIDRVFRNNDNIETVSIPASLTDIFNSAFDESRICGEGFTVHPDNPDYASNGDGNLYDKSFSYMCRYAQGKGVTEYEIPDGVTNLGWFCFTDIDLDQLTLKNVGLKMSDYCIYGGRIDHLVIEEGVKELGDFSGFVCQDTVRNLPSTLEDVGTQNEIIDASNIEAINVASGGIFTSINGILYEYWDDDKTTMTLHMYPHAKTGSSYATPAGVVRASWMCLRDNPYLKDIVFSEEVTYVGSYAIEYMDDITVTFENPECEIDNYAIERCDNVTIKGFLGSTAESFAANNSYTFVSIGDSLGKMDTPTNLRWDGETARWDPVEGATRYEVKFYFENDSGYTGLNGTYTVTDNLDDPKCDYPDGLWYKSYSYFFTVTAQKTMYEPSDVATSPVTHGRFTLNKPEISVEGSVLKITPYYDDEDYEADNYYIWFENVESGFEPSVLRGTRIYREHSLDLQKYFDEKNEGGAIPYGEYRIFMRAHRVIYGWEVDVSEVSDSVYWNYGRDISKCEITLDPDAFTYDGELKKPGVTVKDGDTVLAEGTDYTLTYKKNKNPGRASVIVSGKGNYSSSVEKKFLIYFTDVPKSHSYHQAVYWAVEEGIAAGYTGKKLGLFGVADNITRGQVVMFLWRAAGQPEPVKTTQTFSDVPTSHNFFKAVQWAVEQGITAGYSGARKGQFGPSDNCTRGQIAMFLWRYAGQHEPSSSEQKFSDVKPSNGFFKAVQWAAEQGITAGYKDGTFGVNKTCTRGQCVTFLYRMNQKGFLK